jgi:formylmethanofuran dehydrogenase subunit B
LVCTGCSCLCDDIQVEIEDGRLGRIENACAKGTAYLRSGVNPQRRARSLVRGQSVSVEEAVEEAARLLSKAKRRLIFGLDNSTLEAQAIAIDLTRKLGAVIDDASSFSWGALIKSLLCGQLPTCSLSEVKDNADLLIYWGSNPPHTHPRHLSKFTYYAYSSYNPAGWFPKVKLSCVEVRDTELSFMCKPVFRIKPGGDRDFIRSVLGEAQSGREDSRSFLEMVTKSHFCVIFCGAGLSYSLDGEFGLFNDMVRRFSQTTRMAVIPMVAEANLRGFSQSLYAQTGHVNQVSFGAGVSHGNEFSFAEQVRKGLAECVLVLGSDPFSALPQSLMRNLQGTSIICLDRFSTPTTIAADVVIPTALPGLECGGSMVRMDGDKMALVGPKKGDYPTEEEILKQLLQRMG